MSLDEFSIIEKYFDQQRVARDDVILGIGDDSALLKVPVDQVLAVSTDTLVSGVHFFQDMPPKFLGHKALAVNLSDLAAMGAEPAWATLCLTLPKVDEVWIESFCSGFFELAEQYHISLVGGDLTQGSLSVSVQIHGFVPENEALRRDAAKEGDWIFVTGSLGDAGAALQMLKGQITVSETEREKLLKRLYCPQPRVALGQKLRGIANAAIDISDGLAADLSHILSQSRVGAMVLVDEIPLSEALLSSVGAEKAKQFALSAGEDYELFFTVSEDKRQQYAEELDRLFCVCIGKIEKESGLCLQNAGNCVYDLHQQGYCHFSQT